MVQAKQSMSWNLGTKLARRVHLGIMLVLGVGRVALGSLGQATLPEHEYGGWLGRLPYTLLLLLLLSLPLWLINKIPVLRMPAWQLLNEMFIASILAFAVVDYVNVAWDGDRAGRSVTVTHVREIDRPSKGGGHMLSQELTSWEDPRSRIELDRAPRARPGDRIELTVHRGWLGIGWVSAARLAEPLVPERRERQREPMPWTPIIAN